MGEKRRKKRGSEGGRVEEGMRENGVKEGANKEELEELKEDEGKA